MIDIRRPGILCALLVMSAACAGDEKKSEAEGKTVDSANGELDVPRRKGPPYRAVAVTAVGSISGTVAMPTAAAAPAAGSCAGRAPKGPAPMVVYLEDIDSGRAMPANVPRRFELAAGACEITPRVTLMTAGGTLNLSNAVRYVHHVAFTFEGMKNPMLRVPFSDPGQVVPTERVLAVPGVVDVRSDQDPSVRARIVVVDHPYAVTTTDGKFAIDSVPPGTYTIVAVGPGGRTESRVEVAANSASVVRMEGQ